MHSSVLAILAFSATLVAVNGGLIDGTGFELKGERSCYHCAGCTGEDKGVLQKCTRFNTACIESSFNVAVGKLNMNS